MRPPGRDGQADEYDWTSELPAHNHSYLAPAILQVLGDAKSRRMLDIGCGNGSLTKRLATAGFDVVGIESSESGVREARKSDTQAKFEVHDLQNRLPAELLDSFDVVVAAEVIEHLLLPRELFYRAREALTPGGVAVFSTPFHGYWKNLALALTGKFDHHWRPTWDYGHVKFFSEATLARMANECGFEVLSFKRVGRISPLAKTMVMTARPV